MKELIYDTNRMEWKYRPTSTDGKIFGQKVLVKDPDMKMEIVMNRYPAGFTTYMHTHPCGHGLFILKGQMKINEQYFGANTLIWFPEGCVAEHGATAHEDAEVLLISNKEFSIHYVKDEEEREQLDQGIQPIVSDVGRMPWFYRMASTSGKLYGPGTMIWYPEGCLAEHGATAYEDCICLQTSNKEQKMLYVRKEYQK